MRALLIAALLTLNGCAALLLPAVVAPQPSKETSAADLLNSARLHTALAAGYYNRHQYDIALEELAIALRALPNFAPAYNMLGLVYMDLREDAKASASFGQALRIDPNDSDANNNYGWFLCQRGDPAKAIPYFQAANRNPLYNTPEKSLVNAALCARKLNDDAAAERYLRQALEVRPGEPQALYQLAEMSYQRGDLSETRDLLLRYMRADNPSPEALWLGVRTERRLGDRNTAASYAAQLCRRFPESSECSSVRAGAER